MRVRMERSGGLAYLPGLQEPIEVDTDDLSPDDASELKDLVHQTRLMREAPTAAGKGGPGAADGLEYQITVRDGDDERSVGVRDPLPNPAISALIDYLTRRRSR